METWLARLYKHYIKERLIEMYPVTERLKPNNGKSSRENDMKSDFMVCRVSFTFPQVCGMRDRCNIQSSSLKATGPVALV